MKLKTAEEITTEFFKRRWPEKDIQFEKDCGYFWEWVARFSNDNPERHMDNISLQVWEDMQEMLE